MDAERYLLVKQAFAEVSRAPFAERGAVLRRVCGDDIELLREVEALLAHDRSAPGGILGGKPEPPSSSAAPGSSFEGDFAPGEVLIGRYRIISLVGEGGMGQVYRADDLVLGQPVAVKFLPEHIAERAGGLERFRAEVRHARQVTHPNVARVHDIGETGGRHFLTMEFVDGEDLASLVKRIGRLPGEKASQIAQQVCSALGEAHRKGVLHRDLKPANVMLDGEGRVRLTDFGLAIAAEAEGDSGLAGTPQYMAPEQLSGVAASVRTEVYSLGLLLYELYTGRRALRGRSLEELRLEHEGGGPDSPSSHLEELDPGVDALLTRCLSRDPALRPASVSEVARALPGGDPLAAAIAAGETPAPNVVAAAAAGGALTPRRGLALVCFGALSLIALIVARPWLGFNSEYGEPTAVLRERARELVAELTGGARFAHQIHWYQLNASLDDEAPVATRWNPLLHHSRFGPRSFVAEGEAISFTDPPPVPGSAHLVLDADGALLFWSYRVAELDAQGTVAPPDTWPEFDWAPLLRRAGFDPDALQATAPSRAPDRAATERLAWLTARPSEANGGQLRIEVASDQGRPVLFEVIRGEQPLDGRSPGGRIGFLFLFLTGAAALVAWRNVKKGRADVRGALKVGALFFFPHFILVFGRSLPDDFFGFSNRLWIRVDDTLGFAVSATLFYLALEPLARKRWPHTLIAWNRLLEGRFRDTRVGREILIGITAGPAAMLFALSVNAALVASGVDLWGGPLWGPGGLAAGPPGLEGPLQMLCNVVHTVGDGVFFGMLQIFLLVLVRAVPRLGWSANWIWVAMMTLLGSLFWPVPLALVLILTMLILLTRVGLLSVLVVQASWILCAFPMTLSPRDWYFPSSLVLLASLAAAVGWSYRAAVASQRPSLSLPRPREKKRRKLKRA